MTRTQYSDIISEKYFIEYKRADEKRKNEILEEVFRKIREINTFPMEIIDFKTEYETIRTLVKMNVYDFYDEKKHIIKLNSVGLNLTYKYYPNIFDVKKKKKLMSMREGFYNDKELKTALRLNLEYDNSIVGLRRNLRLNNCGYTMNFRPSAAKIIYEINTNRGARVLDYAAGYGGRLLGAWASENVIEYVGLEPNSETYKNAQKFIEFLNSYQRKEMRVLKECSEEFTVERYPQYKNYFDLAFSSPPYFDLEIYSDEDTQSYNRYNTYELWVKRYLRPTIHNCIDMLKEGGIFAINIYENLHNIKNIIIFICNEKGFKLYKEDRLAINVRPGDGHNKTKGNKEKGEPIWYFRRA